MQSFPGVHADAPARERVVLVNGLWMPAAVCRLLGRRLRAMGYATAAFSYPSVRGSLEDSARSLAAFAGRQAAPRVHLVGHSLGGLVVLRMLAQAPEFPVGRVVLLGSPCAGCLAAAQLSRSRTGRRIVGRALPGWRPDYGAEVVRRTEIGSIAGTARFGLGALLVRLPEPNDGVVTVEETRLPGFADHRVLPVAHSAMVVSARVAAEVAAFLRNGRFSAQG